MKIVLLGYMGCGKTAIGKKLSKTLKFPFIDLDAAIEADENMLITKLFETKGEIFFRKKENILLKAFLENQQDTVLALGGGTPCYGNVMQLLAQADDVFPIYLSATAHTLTERLFLEKESRPMIAHISDKEILNDFIRKHLFERNFYYNQAPCKVKVDEKSIEEIVKEIVALLF
ncbi:MAG: shikimate kinase [Patiriisocius sp.]|jgi:shikimate kinase